MPMSWPARCRTKVTTVDHVANLLYIEFCQGMGVVLFNIATIYRRMYGRSRIIGVVR